MPNTLKPSWLVSLALLLASSGGFASPTAPLPTVDEIVKRALERGETEIENEQLFKERYYFVRSRHTEIRNSKGDIKKQKIRISTNAPIAALVTNMTAGASAKPEFHSPKQAAAARAKGSDDLSGKQDKREHLQFGKELVKRYDFTIVGREVTNGTSLLVVDFAPKNEKLPEKDLRDKVVNRMAGRLWLDEREYAVKRCTMRLTRSLKIIGGLVGEAHKFNFMFERERTEDGLWYIAESKWHLEGRQVVVYREADYQEKRTEVRKLGNLEPGGWVRVTPAEEADMFSEEETEESAQPD